MELTTAYTPSVEPVKVKCLCNTAVSAKPLSDMQPMYCAWDAIPDITIISSIKIRLNAILENAILRCKNTKKN